MERVYSRIQWENLPSTATPIDEDNLNKTDYAIYMIDGRVIEHQRLIEGLQNYEARAAESAGKAELSETNAATSEQNAANSSVAASNSASLASQSATNASTSESNSEAWAVGKRGGIPVQTEDETYHNNSKYYAEQASAVSRIVIMTGATDTDDGLAGYVPSPQRGDNKKALFGDGTFKEVKSSALLVDSEGYISIDYSILKGE